MLVVGRGIGGVKLDPRLGAGWVICIGGGGEGKFDRKEGSDGIAAIVDGFACAILRTRPVN